MVISEWVIHDLNALIHFRHIDSLSSHFLAMQLSYQLCQTELVHLDDYPVIASEPPVIILPFQSEFN